MRVTGFKHGRVMLVIVFVGIVAGALVAFGISNVTLLSCCRCVRGQRSPAGPGADATPRSGR